MPETIEIPRAMFVACPKFGFKRRRAALCATCERFGGLIDVTPDAPAGTPFEKQYRVSCAHPIARSMIVVEED